MFELIDFLIVNPIINILLVIYNYIGDFGVAMIVFIFQLRVWILCHFDCQISYLATHQKTICSDEVDA